MTKPGDPNVLPCESENCAGDQGSKVGRSGPGPVRREEDGGVRPLMMTEVLSEEVRSAILKQIPVGRFGKVEDVAHCALFLASEQANYINGQVIQVDGGLVM